MPKREIHVERKASAHEDEEMEERGVASSQRVVLSIIVRMVNIPGRWEGGQQCQHGHGKIVFLGLGWEGVGEKHGGGFLLF
jgi:hypothetical protein